MAWDQTHPALHPNHIPFQACLKLSQLLLKGSQTSVNLSWTLHWKCKSKIELSSWRFCLKTFCPSPILMPYKTIIGILLTTVILIHTFPDTLFFRSKDFSHLISFTETMIFKMRKKTPSYRSTVGYVKFFHSQEKKPSKSALRCCSKQWQLNRLLSSPQESGKPRFSGECETSSHHLWPQKFPGHHVSSSALRAFACMLPACHFADVRLQLALSAGHPGWLFTWDTKWKSALFRWTLLYSRHLEFLFGLSKEQVNPAAITISIQTMTLEDD